MSELPRVLFYCLASWQCLFLNSCIWLIILIKFKILCVEKKAQSKKWACLFLYKALNVGSEFSFHSLVLPKSHSVLSLYFLGFCWGTSLLFSFRLNYLYILVLVTCPVVVAKYLTRQKLQRKPAYSFKSHNLGCRRRGMPVSLRPPWSMSSRTL